MEKSAIKYSLKNVPIPSKESYQLNLIDKIESLVKRMRWRAFYYLNQQKAIMTSRKLLVLNQGRVHHLVPILFYSKKTYQTW